jgi:3-deoxy-D-manno-octulosonic-acid transferase
MKKRLGYFWYTLSTQAYFVLVKILAPFNERAKLLAQAQQKAWPLIWQSNINPKDFTIWFHVSSLGEFEQGKPLMLALKQAKPDCKIVVSFFSPSGFLAKQNDPAVDTFLYLPFESKKKAALWVQTIQPNIAIWVKYDFWHQYLQTLHNQKIPVFLIAAQFRPQQIFFKKWAVFQRSTLALFTHIFCQNKNTQTLLNTFGLNLNSHSGDNRYDRVKDYATKLESIPFIADFKNNQTTLILGSSYTQEETLLAQFLGSNSTPFKTIIAPHFVNEKRIMEIENMFLNKTIRYSQVSAQTEWNKFSILIIDSMGYLARLYRFGDLAFVGGGFWENGLHNSLEPCAFGMPIAFGPKLKRFPEAQELVSLGLATAINDQKQFNHWLQTNLTTPEARLEKAVKCRQFVAENAGATNRVMAHIQPYL